MGIDLRRLPQFGVGPMGIRRAHSVLRRDDWSHIHADGFGRKPPWQESVALYVWTFGCRFRACVRTLCVLYRDESLRKFRQVARSGRPLHADIARLERFLYRSLQVVPVYDTGHIAFTGLRDKDNIL